MTPPAHSRVAPAAVSVPTFPETAVSADLLLEHLPSAVWWIDHRGLIIYANASARRWTPDEAVGREFQTVVDAQLAAPARSELIRRLHCVLESADPQTVHPAPAVTAHGNGSQWDFTFRPLSLSGGAMGVICVANEVSEHVRTAQLLRMSEERLQAVFNQAAVGIAISDLQGRFEQVNARFAEILGYRPAELHGRTFLELTFPEDLPLTRNVVERLLAENTSEFSFEKRYLRRDGGVVWSRTSGALQRDAQGRPARLIGAIEDITQRKLAEEALRRSEQFNRTIIESSRDCIKTLSLTGEILWMNEAGRRTLGLQRIEDVIGRSWITFWNEHDARAAREAVEAAAGGGTRTFRGGFVLRDRKRWWEVVLSPVFDAEGRPQSLLAVSRDVSERHAAEDQLRESETRFRQLADSMPQMVWAASADGRGDYYNRRWYEFSGIPENATGDESWRPVIHPDDLPLIIEGWSQAVRSGEPYQTECRYRRRDGQYRWHLARALPVRDPAGRIERWYGTSTDIHEQKLTAEALQEAYTITERLNEVARALATELDLRALAQLIIDASTRITRAQYGAFFYHVADDHGAEYLLHALAGVPGDGNPLLPDPHESRKLAPTFQGLGIIRSADVRRDPRFSGSSSEVAVPGISAAVASYLAVPVISRSGEVLGGLFFGHPDPDVFTARDERIVIGVAAQAAAAMDVARAYASAQQARATAEQANQAKDHFIAALSHELRTPLTPVLAILDQLQSDSDLTGSIRADLETVQRNVALEARLIDDLLDLTRISQGKLELHLQRLSLVRIVEDAITTCLPDLSQKQLTLVRHFDCHSAWVQADDARLTQVCWNLLKNAIKFTPEGGEIQVRVRLLDGAASPQVALEISDTGIGIETAHLDRIFDAFEQGDRAITRQFGGLGLGLAISKAIVETHQGGLTATSRGPGFGSTFTVTLPVLPPDPSGPRATPAHRATAVPSSARPLRILLVEDHEDSAAVFTRLLRRAGHEVHFAATLEEARTRAKELTSTGTLDLVISDLGLPDGSGLELMQELRTLGPIPAIALSGFGMDTDRAQTAAAGFSRHLTKPVNPTVLLQTIQELLLDPR